MTTITANVITDAGHGWLSVSKKDLKRINYPIETITTYSYINKNRVYLEEDCDLSAFCKFCEDNNITIEQKKDKGSWPSYSFVRRYPSFSVGRFNLDLQVGQTYTSAGNARPFILEYTITKIQGNMVWVKDQFGLEYNKTSIPRFMLCIKL